MVRLTRAVTAGSGTGLLVLTCEFDNLTAYGNSLDDTLMDPEAQTYNHRIREAEAPFVYESTAVLAKVDLERSEAKRGHGRVLDARLGRALRGRWEDALAFARAAFDLCDRHGAVGCRLFELNHAGPQTGVLCAVMEYNSMAEFGQARDAWLTDSDAQKLTDTMRRDSPFEPVSSGLYTEVAML